MKYEFGDYILDTERNELCRHAVPVPMEPRVFKCLVYLIQYRDTVVTKAELLAHVWSDVTVGDDSITNAVWLARQAVGDSGQTQHTIKNVTKGGYRFIAPVKVRGDAMDAGYREALEAINQARHSEATILNLNDKNLTVL